MKMYGEGMYIAMYVFLASAIDGEDWSASRHEERSPHTKLIGGCLGPRIGLDDLEREGTFCTYWDSNCNPPVVHSLSQSNISLQSRSACFTWIYSFIKTIYARGSVVFKALCYKPEGRGLETQRGECMILFSVQLILPAALGPGVSEAERGRRVGLTNLPPSVSRLPNLNISQLYRPRRPIKRIFLLYLLKY
jgi:hypothetical protein